MNKRHFNYSRLFVSGVSILLSLIYCPPFDQELDDKEIFRYTGLAILRGQVPYRDFFDHKPPMIFFINSAGILLGGPWGLWLINTLLALLATLLLFRLCRQYRLPYPWLLPLLFNLMLRDRLISLGINMTREYTTFFLIIFFCVLLGKYRYKYFLLGLLSALIFFTQQDQVLSLIPFLFYIFLATVSVPVLTRLIGLCAGFLSITLPLLVYFALHRSLSFFWEDAFVFNFAVYTTEKKSIGDHFRTIKHALDAGNYEIPFMVALILGITALFLQNKKKRLVLAALVTLFLSMAPEFMGARVSRFGVFANFTYYFLPVSASVCMVLFTVFAFTEDAILADRTAQLPYALLLCCSLSYTALQHSTHMSRRDSDPTLNRPELSFLRQQKVGDYQLYIFYEGQYIYFYNELKILAPSRWIYQHFWSYYANWDPDHRLLESIAEDLLRHHTTYIIMDAGTLSDFYNPSNREWWLSFMQDHYQPVSLPGIQHSILWKLKEN
jgi:hypothetical protein